MEKAELVLLTVTVRDRIDIYRFIHQMKIAGDNKPDRMHGEITIFVDHLNY